MLDLLTLLTSSRGMKEVSIFFAKKATWRRFTARAGEDETAALGLKLACKSQEHETPSSRFATYESNVFGAHSIAQENSGEALTC